MRHAKTRSNGEIYRRLISYLAVVLVVSSCLAIAGANTLKGETAYAAAPSPTTSVAAADATAPTPLYVEDFENGSVSPTPGSLSSYEGDPKNNNGTTTKYTAARYWLNAGYCNGFVTSGNTSLSQSQIDSTYCGRNPGYGPGDYMAVRVKAYELGLLKGESSTAALSNHALSTNTSGGMPSTDISSPDSIMFQTSASTPIKLSKSSGRFLEFSVDAANTYCENQYHPKMEFEYTQDGVTKPLPTQNGVNGVIDPCTSAGSKPFDASSQFPAGGNSWVNTGAVGTFYSGAFTTQSANPIGLILRNISLSSSQGKGIGNSPANTPGYVAGSENGNDGAIDNISIVDATPTMEKSFSPAVQSVGRTSTMTLTVKNRSDLEEKSGWGFTDTLPANLHFANDTVGGTCAATSRIDVSKGSLTVSNGTLNQGESSCTITATVTSTVAASYVNGDPNGNFTDEKLIDGPQNAKVAFYSGSVTWSKVDSSNPDTKLSGSVWTLKGPDQATTSTPSDGWPVGDVTDCVSSSASDCTGLDKDPTAGGFKVTGLPSGSYTLTEKTAPDGYVLDTSLHRFAITINDSTTASPVVSLGAITNAQGTATWAKSDSATGDMLSGSEWTLTNTTTKESTTVTDCLPTTSGGCASLEDKDPRAGQFSVHNLAPGSYTLTETKAPEGYQMLDKPLGPLTIDGTHLSIDFQNISNTKVTQVTWKKSTDEADVPLAGSQWKLTGGDLSADGIVIADCSQATCSAPNADTKFYDVDPASGAFKITGLPLGTYTLQEYKAPAGYKLSSATHPFTLTAQQTSYSFTAAFTDEQQGHPSLPLTGGQSIDSYLIGGSLIMILSLGIGYAMHRRRAGSVR